MNRASQKCSLSRLPAWSGGLIAHAKDLLILGSTQNRQTNQARICDGARAKQLDRLGSGIYMATSLLLSLRIWHAYVNLAVCGHLRTRPRSQAPHSHHVNKVETMLLAAAAIFLSSRLLFSEAHAAEPLKPLGLTDLGYAKYIPTWYYETRSGFNISVYKNIRFANPPTGSLRFRLPDTKLPVAENIQDGRENGDNTDCISSMPSSTPFPPYNGTTWGQEDCLFLDVWVPQGIRSGEEVPVLHWFVGGAFAFGSKEMFVSPTGLFDMMDEHTKFIFVANNYRYHLPSSTQAKQPIADILSILAWESQDGRTSQAMISSPISGCTIASLPRNGRPTTSKASGGTQNA